MDNENKKIDAPADTAEFEIPDISVLGEEFAPVERPAPPEKPKRTRKKTEPKPETEAGADAPLKDEVKPEGEKPKRTRKKAEPKPEAEAGADAPLKDEVKPEAEAGADAPLKDEVKPEGEKPKRTRKKAEPKPEAEADADAPLKAEVKPEGEKPKRTRKKAEPKPEPEADADAPLKDEADADAEKAVEEENGGVSETVAPDADEAKEADATEEDSDLLGFELDEEGRRIIPEDLFPDDALSAPKEEAPTVDTDLVIDLLGDLVSEEPPTPSPEYIPMDDAPSPMSPAKAAPEDEDKYDPDKPRRIDVIFDFVELLVFTLVAVLCITSFFFKHAVVEGGSMLNTLEQSDVLLISDVFYKPSRGDIVVIEDYTLENSDMHKPIVKRVIAVEGQMVRIERNAIYVNGERLIEPYVHIDEEGYEYYDYRYDRKAIENGPLAELEHFFINNDYLVFIVPEGEVFVLGDHRNDSTDSRSVGTVREDAILGKVLLRLYPFDKFGTVNEAD